MTRSIARRPRSYRLEQAYFSCKEVPWKDERPEGYSFYPFKDGYYQFHETVATHRFMSVTTGALMTEILTSLAPRIEDILGYHWTAGAVLGPTRDCRPKVAMFITPTCGRWG